MRFAPLIKPIVLALAFSLLSTPTNAHDDEEFAHDRQPPYGGAGYRADEGGSPSISFERCDCKPVSRFSQNGLEQLKLSSVGRCCIIRSQIITALSPVSTPT